MSEVKDDGNKPPTPFRENWGRGRRTTESQVLNEHADRIASLEARIRLLEAVAAAGMRLRSDNHNVHAWEALFVALDALPKAPAGESGGVKPAREFVLRGGTAHCPSFIHEGQERLKDGEEIRVREVTAGESGGGT